MRPDTERVVGFAVREWSRAPGRYQRVMRGVMMIIPGVLVAALFAVACSGANGTPVPAPEPAVALEAAVAPEAQPAPGADGAELRALIEGSMSWMIGADPGKRAWTLPPGTLDDAVQAVRPPEPAGNGSGAPAMGGGWARGVMIEPAEHPDARPWPLGMVIHPGKTKDPMVIPPGGDGLQSPKKYVSSGWRKLFADLAQSATSPGEPQVL